MARREAREVALVYRWSGCPEDAFLTPSLSTSGPSSVERLVPSAHLSTWISTMRTADRTWMTSRRAWESSKACSQPHWKCLVGTRRRGLHRASVLSAVLFSVSTNWASAAISRICVLLLTTSHVRAVFSVAILEGGRTEATASQIAVQANVCGP